MAEHNGDLKRLWRKTGILIIALLIIGILLAILVDQAKGPLHIVPKSIAGPIKALIVLMIGGAISYLLERYLFQLTSRTLGAKSTTSLRFIIRLLLLFAVILSVLAAFGVGLSSVVFGGAFVTAIIGLAGQTMFGNLIAGIALIIFHPFEVGDRVNIVSSQYPVIWPTFPHEATKPAYSGVVIDITLMYTSVLTDNGPVLAFPNGIIIQAAVENLSRTTRRAIRIRFDVDINLDPHKLLPQAEKMLQTLGYSGVHPQIIDVTPSTYSLLIVVDAHSNADDEIRHRIFSHLVPIIQKYKHELAINPDAQGEDGDVKKSESKA
ncbi:mechanosensitive ion channel family protein [Sulfobacillus thermosulfidooxidans]|uniref:Mechanosensitive ion channel n=1 Tax=Sulfobacillus thermosulfidooxidans (strain DSM 9293 / VKM B-1269 / AT-1) TaxID=929705 RepID=A0A1W1WN34_SULTA|nr:mechanosensitive ion channel family protein [Sulfobacillus thermosulfidooxidans]OLZ09785.1 mechanosensitive ion channel protein MscS [Sulfobacillus thermosulfidooxidans]OLZ15908.1 mechanosensitive ion channel protein MscS [Sulfobacillus thermosulfidooxidans]OLZ18244.1 mechanosensitive ion channel protein MscS [Sulfobacillus thermosulfidooxidans]SMC07635.1 Mechanosensitive ion channel [Sulfobacillus thermosulfidooxidans DSM 9293]